MFLVAPGLLRHYVPEDCKLNISEQNLYFCPIFAKLRSRIKMLPAPGNISTLSQSPPPPARPLTVKVTLSFLVVLPEMSFSLYHLVYNHNHYLLPCALMSTCLKYLIILRYPHPPLFFNLLIN